MSDDHSRIVISLLHLASRFIEDWKCYCEALLLSETVHQTFSISKMICSTELTVFFSLTGSLVIKDLVYKAKAKTFF